jgi:hypothetical protein
VTPHRGAGKTAEAWIDIVVFAFDVERRVLRNQERPA